MFYLVRSTFVNFTINGFVFHFHLVFSEVDACDCLKSRFSHVILLFLFLAKCCPASPSSLVCVATSFSPCNGLALMQAFLVLDVSWWRSSFDFVD